jgi:hypothetical protein
MQKVKNKFKKDTEIVGKNKIEILEMKCSISQIKSLAETLFSRLDQIANRIPRHGDKVPIIITDIKILQIN